jgi:hypothetical protein
VTPAEIAELIGYKRGSTLSVYAPMQLPMPASSELIERHQDDARQSRELGDTTPSQVRRAELVRKFHQERNPTHATPYKGQNAKASKHAKGH